MRVRNSHLPEFPNSHWHLTWKPYCESACGGTTVAYPCGAPRLQIVARKCSGNDGVAARWQRGGGLTAVLAVKRCGRAAERRHCSGASAVRRRLGSDVAATRRRRGGGGGSVARHSGSASNSASRKRIINNWVTGNGQQIIGTPGKFHFVFTSNISNLIPSN